jgi:methionyl-tRNA formyltransferase
MLGGERIKFIEVKTIETATPPQPGQFQINNNRLIIGCGNQTALAIEKLQPENRRVMGINAFLKGRIGLTHGQFN